MERRNRIPLSRFGITKHTSLYPHSPDTPRDLTFLERTAAVWPLVKTTIIELLEQNPEVFQAALSEHTNSPLSTMKTLIDLTHKVVYIDIAKRAANGTQLALLSDSQAEYGENHHSAREVPHFNDHGHSHTRRLSPFLKTLVLLDRNFPRNSQYFDALFLFPKNHDAYQLDAVRWNTENPQAKIKSKDRHEEFGALMLGAQTETYARERHIAPARARIIVRTAMLITLVHGQPRTAEARLRATQKAYTIQQGVISPLADDELFAAYQNNTLDLTSISDAQFHKIVQHFRPKNSFPSTSGLHPAFDNSHEKELTQMKTDYTPWFLDIPAEDREHLISISQKANAADLFDMIYPSKEAFLRKINVEIATTRPLFQLMTVDDFRKAMDQTDGNQFTADFPRAFWEFFSVLHTLKATMHSSSFIKKQIQEIVIYGLLDTRKMFVSLMQGESGLEAVSTAYNRRAITLGIKALKRVAKRWTEDTYQHVFSQAMAQDSLNAIKDFFLGALATQEGKTVRKYRNRFLRSIAELTSEQIQTIDKLRRKPDNTDTKLRTYSPAEFSAIDICTREALSLARDVLGISDTQLKELIQLWRNGQHARFPTGTFDKIGSLEDVRTLVHPPKQVRDRLTKLSE